MPKNNRGRAPRDRKKPYQFPKPPCSPELPRPPEPVRPHPPGCDTGPTLDKLRKRLRHRS